MANRIFARVTAPNGLFSGSVLHQPGELIEVDLDELGIPDLSKTNALQEVDEDTLEPISTMEISPVAPHAPNPDMPQGMPSGTKHSGTGRLLQTTGAGENAGSTEIRAPSPLVPAGADLVPETPVRRDTDIDAKDPPVAGSKVPSAETAQSLADSNTKAALLELAASEGVTANETMSKGDIATAIVAGRTEA